MTVIVQGYSVHEHQIKSSCKVATLCLSKMHILLLVICSIIASFMVLAIVKLPVSAIRTVAMYMIYL